MQPESWRPIDGWPEYSISDLGRVRSEHRVVTRCNGTRYTVGEKILRGHRHRFGVLSVALTRPGEKQHRVYVHQLMTDQWKN